MSSNPALEYSETFRKNLLAVDACLIAENDTHIVVAVRLDRQTARRNHQFLAVISDALGTGGGDGA